MVNFHTHDLLRRVAELFSIVQKKVVFFFSSMKAQPSIKYGALKEKKRYRMRQFFFQNSFGMSVATFIRAVPIF